ncbi:DNA repair protein RecO [candidate division KSB1 bacterium]|nr:MAG: DNA repair protein RecO [candidate division KSB1 bacterium]
MVRVKMAILKTEAIVLRMQEYGESSKILTLYTRDYGRLKVLAKGARRLKSRFGGVLDLINYITIVFYQKVTRDLPLLSQADLVRPFLHLREDLHRLALASALVELIDRTESGQMPNPRLFKLLVGCLIGIDESGNAEVYFDYFTLHFLGFAGFRPRLRRCLHCGQKPKGYVVNFQFRRGGYFCENCSSNNQEGGLQVSVATIHSLLALRDANFTTVGQFSFSQTIQREIEALFLYFLRYHVEGFRNSTSLEFLQRLDKNNLTQWLQSTQTCKEEISV